MSALLALELSPDPSSLALELENGRCFERSFSGERGRALLSEVDALLQEADIAQSELRGIVVGIGPGSYTGLRIACTAARTLAFALDTPCGGVGSFDAAIAAAGPGRTDVVLDAYRGEVYHGAGEMRDGRLVMQHAPRVCELSELKELSSADRVVCDARLMEALAAHQPKLYLPRAKTLLQLARQQGVDFAGHGFDALPAAEPMYLRAAAFRPKPSA